MLRVARLRRAAARADPLLVALLVVAALGLVFGAGDAPHRSQVTVFWLLMAVLGGIFILLGVRIAALAKERADRRLWRLCAVAGLLLSAGDAIQLVLAIQDPNAPSSTLGGSVQQGALVAAMIALLAGLLSYPLAVASVGARARLRMDVLSVLAAAVTFGFWAIVLPTGRVDLIWLGRLLSSMLIAPGFFLVAVFAVLRLVLGGRSPFDPLAGRLIGLATVVQVVAQTIPVPVYLDRTSGPWLMGVNVLASALLALGARVQESRARRDHAVPRPAPKKPYSLLPYWGMAATWGLLVVVLVAGGPVWRSWLVGLGTAVTTALVIYRQAAAFRHIGELLVERDALAAQLTEQAFRDALTGLGNRALFMQRLTAALRAGPATVFLIDLDDFKPVNDRHGHAAGDRLLIEVGVRLLGCVRESDTVARLGGDEFAVLMAGLDDGGRDAVTATLRDALHGVVRVGTADALLSASVGAATGSGDPDGLLHRADMAMYAAKGTSAAARHPAVHAHG